MKEVRNRSLKELAEAAFRQMAEKVVERAKASGTQLILWEDGKVKKVDPDNWNRRKRKAVRD